MVMYSKTDKLERTISVGPIIYGAGVRYQIEGVSYELSDRTLMVAIYNRGTPSKKSTMLRHDATFREMELVLETRKRKH